MGDTFSAIMYGHVIDKIEQILACCVLIPRIVPKSLPRSSVIKVAVLVRPVSLRWSGPSSAHVARQDLGEITVGSAAFLFLR